MGLITESADPKGKSRSSRLTSGFKEGSDFFQSLYSNKTCIIDFYDTCS